MELVGYEDVEAGSPLKSLASWQFTGQTGTY
nr:MAG TPA: hypothetical protein [Bacteriophage sp.]